MTLDRGGRRSSGIYLLKLSKIEMSSLDAQVRELMKNQNHILEAIKYLDERVKDIIDKEDNDKGNEVDNILESQAMIDQIIVQNSDAIAALKKAKDENCDAIKHLDTKIDNIDTEIEMTKKLLREKEDMVRNKVKLGLANSVTCVLCDKSFNRIVDLEKHIQASHDKHQVFQCDQCGKAFTLKWRLEKHMNLHTSKNVKPCHYFNNKKECPFEEYGCKFQHIVSKKCHFDHRCQKRLCPYKHSKEASNVNNDTEIDDVIDSESEMEADECTVDTGSFLTSTPQKRKFECNDCIDKTQCTDCYVREATRHSVHVHFSDEC